MIRVALALVLVATPAIADPKDDAKMHFKAARALQDRGDYSRAADEYKAAYELDHRPEMLFNVAQAYRLAGELRNALDYYQQYLIAQPTGAGAAEAREHVAAITKLLDSTRPPTPVEPATPPPTPVAPEPPPPERPRPQITSNPKLKIAGLATAGAGVIAIAAGVKFGLDARAAAADISKHDTGPWTEAEMTRFADGQRANRNMVIAYVAGGALVATGGVLYVLGSRTHVVPVVTASTAGVGVWGRF